MFNSIAILAKNIRITDGLYSLNDLHVASGNEPKHRPSLFMANAQTKELINEINLSSNSCLAHKTLKGGKTPGTYVCEDLVYAYAMWISAKFSLIVIRAFKAMNTPVPQITTDIISDEQAGILYHIVHARAAGNGKLVAEMWGRLKKHFGYASYHKLKAIHFDEAKTILETMELHGEVKALPAVSITNVDKQVALLIHHAKYLCDALQDIIKPLSDLGSPYTGRLRGHADELMCRVNLVEKYMTV